MPIILQTEVRHKMLRLSVGVLLAEDNYGLACYPSRKYFSLKDVWWASTALYNLDLILV